MHPPLRPIALALLLTWMAGIGCGGDAARSSRTATAAKSSGGLTPEAFFRDPLLSYVVLSPDGKRLAAVSTVEGVATLIVRPTWGGEVQGLAKLSRPGMSISTVGWANEDVILVVYEMPVPDGNRARRSRVTAVDVDAARPRDLSENWLDESLPVSQNRVIDWLPDDPKHVLIQYREADSSGTSAARIDVKTGSLETVVPAERFVQQWYADPEGNVRVGQGIREGKWIALARLAPEGEFEKLVEFDPLTGEGFTFAGYGPEPSALYVGAPTANDRVGLFTYDVGERALGAPVFADPVYDVGPIVLEPSTGRLRGVEIVREQPAIHFVDDAAAREQAAIDRAFSGNTNRIVSLDRDGGTAIVAVSGDRKPPEYYVFDRAKKQMDFLFSAYPLLNGKSLAPTKSVRYPARDGLEIQAYLTLPSGPQQGLPVIVMPHDGPTGRDVWGWNATVQYLVSRGFAVFQPNYRGSTGFGREHARRGFGQWGRAMQDDLSDGVAWLVSQGIADADRVGIYGVGYGGYAALEALAKNPELFRAGASLGGITDLAAWLESDELAAGDKATIGPAAKQADELKATSPVRHADRIRAPVLIAHGELDPIVFVEQSRRMADALEDADGTVETHYYRNEVHGFLDEQNRIDFHEKLAAFFTRHLAPRTAAPAPTGATR